MSNANLRLESISVPASVLGLFARCRPSAVTWVIWAVVINSIKRKAFSWPIAHVCVKALKVFPSLANGDAAATISGIGKVSCIKTTSNHSSPDIVDAGLAHSMSARALTNSFSARPGFVSHDYEYTRNHKKQ